MIVALHPRQQRLEQRTIRFRLRSARPYRSHVHCMSAGVFNGDKKASRVVEKLARSLVRRGGIGIHSERATGAPVLEAQGRPDLEAQHQRLLPLFELAGVVFTDADETRGRLVVGVLDRDLEGPVRGRLRALDVASRPWTSSKRTRSLRWLRCATGPLTSRAACRSASRSTSAASVSTPSTRTAFKASSPPLTAATDQGAVDGTTYYQPSAQVANDLIGTEIADPPYVRNRSGCPKGRKCRQSDANFSQCPGTARVFARRDRSNDTDWDTLEIDAADPPSPSSGEGVAAEGQTVDKVGRTTGWTRGTVTNTCVNTGVSGSTLVLLCQTFVSRRRRHRRRRRQRFAGVPDRSGGNATLVGGLWGGNSSGTQFVYSPIANIEAELGNLTTH